MNYTATVTTVVLQLERWTVNLEDHGLGPPFKKKILFTSFFLCFSEETLKTAGPIYLVSMAGEETDPTQGVHV